MYLRSRVIRIPEYIYLSLSRDASHNHRKISAELAVIHSIYCRLREYHPEIYNILLKPANYAAADYFSN
jgi:hypothetical protein